MSRETTHQQTEYEVLKLDKHGDIQEVEYFDRKPAALKYLKKLETVHASIELWKTVWRYKKIDGEVDDSYKDTQEKIEYS